MACADPVNKYTLSYFTEGWRGWRAEGSVATHVRLGQQVQKRDQAARRQKAHGELKEVTNE